MSPIRRWFLVLLGVLGLLAVPVVGRMLPVPDSDTSASTLLDRVHRSAAVAYSGFVESTGGLSLPASDDFSDLATLLGERSRMRVWWRGPQDWRVDAIEPTGETDLIRDAGATTIWEYESNRATRTVDADIRLPRSSDLLPPTLARLLLAEATAAQVSRIEAERIAGRNAPGLRFTPAEPQSSLDRVDVWVDPETGLPLRVMVYGGRQRTPAMTTTFLDLSTDVPEAAMTEFAPPPGADLRFDATIDIAAAANRFAPATPPSTLAGLSRSAERDLGAVGEYGRGATRLLAIPIWHESAEALRDQLAATPGSRQNERGIRVSAGPLGLLLTPCGRDEEVVWLLGGTVTDRTLQRAADELVGLAGR
ncbi:MAG TPA: hypothetical protein VFJ14_17675 [Nocardioidaceae bacterium]|nr:hypothetical protein [Nocardioidaceae bacterium]